MTSARLTPVFNGTTVERRQLAGLTLAEFRRAIIDAPRSGRRVSALFAYPAGGKFELMVVLAADEEGRFEVGRTVLDEDSFPSMTPECPQVHLFEREIAEQWRIRPLGHPWLKPVRFQAPLRAEEPGSGLREKSQICGVTDFYRVGGDEVHEVAVGPVHAGVIEPGHFRFQCHGENVLHLEISLGYQHRGIERALAGGPGKRTLHYLETAAGDTTIAHTTAYCHIVEALSGVPATPRAQAIRGIALELERLANHTGDLGALSGDVGFLPTANYCGRLRGDYLNLTALICGNRFGRGLVSPGGAGFDIDRDRARIMLERLEDAIRDVENAVTLLWTTASVQARFEDTGRITPDVARELGLVGLAARACGIKRDLRKTHPLGIYRFAHIPISTWQSSDVYSRAYVRWLEIQRSTAFLRQQINELPAGPVRAKCEKIRPDILGISAVEGWRGEVCHVALTDNDGRFAAYKIVDPSFHNWSGLAMAIRGQQISDFPLCNKSFNLSYCGHDL